MLFFISALFISVCMFTLYTLWDVYLNRQVIDIKRLMFFFMVTCVGLTSSTYFAYAEPTNYSSGSDLVALNIVQRLETGGEKNPDTACSFRGCKYGRGRYQISEILLQEWNQFQKPAYSPSDLFERSVNTKIASWYLRVRIPVMLKHFGRDPQNISLILVSYNAGISYALKNERAWPLETVSYIKAYMGMIS